MQPDILNRNRIQALDLLRGCAALLVMFYHYSSWSEGNSFDSSTLLGRVGIYGVSIFYVLSGLTLFHVYSTYDLKSPLVFSVNFWIKRVFRIFPLLWAATFLTLLVRKSIPDVSLLLLNLTGLFGFISWDRYIAVGAWSIGNELFFYAFFPFLMLTLRYSKIGFYLINVAFLVCFLWFAFFKLDSNSSLSSQWQNYVNPLNQAFLFCGGVLIGYLSKFRIPNITLAAVLAGCFVTFVFFPIEGERIVIVTGIYRLIFTTLSLLVCFCFYRLHFPPKIANHWMISAVGEISYSVYLLHPIVYAVVSIFSEYFMLSITLKILLSSCITIFAAYYNYGLFEKFFIRFGKRMMLTPQSNI